MILNVRFRFLALFIMAIALSGSTFSCDSDDRLPLESGDDSVALLQSLTILPGKNRVEVSGVVPVGSNISEVVIYWNDQAESRTISVNSTEKDLTISTLITGLDEKIYDFEIQTLNTTGKASGLISGSSEVYGDTYSKSLLNRPINANVLSESNLQIDFGQMDLSTGVIGSKIIYEDTLGTLKELFLPIAKDKLEITDFKGGSTYEYKSIFVPSPVAIDTFYTETSSYKPIAFPQLTNSEVPFAASSINGRWGILDHWTTTDPVLIHNGHGGWDEWNNNIFNIESGWGAPAITNGKVYQSVMSGPGEFALEVAVRDSNHSETDQGGAYFVIAKGTTLPDVADVTTAPEVLAYERIHTTSNSGTPEIYTIPYTIEESTTITIGQITTQWGQTPGRFCNIFSFEIVPGN